MSILSKMLSTVMDAAENIPFGNSDTQNRNAIINDEKTPARAARHALLRVSNRMQALIESSYSLRKDNKEIEILKRDREKEPDKLKRELIDLEIERKLILRPYTRKLIIDAMREIESLWPVVQNIGKLSREKFEAEEAEHYRLKHGITLNPQDDLYSNICHSQLNTIASLNFPELLEQIDKSEENKSGPEPRAADDNCN